MGGTGAHGGSKANPVHHHHHHPTIKAIWEVGPRCYANAKRWDDVGKTKKAGLDGKGKYILYRACCPSSEKQAGGGDRVGDKPPCPHEKEQRFQSNRRARILGGLSATDGWNAAMELPESWLV